MHNYLSYPLCILIQINIVAYEYTGYGESTGVVSDIALIENVKTAYDFANKKLGFSWNQIILYIHFLKYL